MFWIIKTHTRTDDAQTKHKKSVRLCFCVLWKAPIVVFHKTRVEMMGSSISQSFQHQLNWKNIFLVATNRYYWDTQRATLQNFGFWKNLSGVNLVSWYCWQLYVVFHFQTNSNALWLENFLLFVRTISWLHFSHWFKFQVFQVAESNVTEIKAATEKIKRVQIVKLRKGLSCLSNQSFWVVNGLEWFGRSKLHHIYHRHHAFPYPLDGVPSLK